MITVNGVAWSFYPASPVELLSKQTSAPNLLSAGRQEIADAFKREYGVTFENVYISNNYLEVTKL